MKWLERITQVNTERVHREVHDFIKYVVTYNVGCDVLIEVNSYTEDDFLKVHVLIQFNLPNKTYYVREDYSTLLDFYDESLLDDNLEMFMSSIKNSIIGITVGELLYILQNKA